MDITRRRRLIGVPLLLAAALALVACSGGGEELGTMSDGAAGDAEPAVSRKGTAAGTAEGAMQSALDAHQATEARERSIISTGTVSLVGRDVGRARFDLQKIVDGHGGEVAEEITQTDDDGEVRRTRLVVRVPAAEFDAAMDELEQVGQLESSRRSSEDVTTQVIDVEARIRAQSASLRRIELLLARARSIRDIVAIEAQLTRRQAELDSLKSQQAWLVDQTSLSTITVFVEQKRDRKGDKGDASGFLAGLGQGWDGLRALVTGALTVTGFLLPFTVLLLLLGVPAWLLLRGLARRRPPRVAAQE